MSPDYMEIRIYYSCIEAAFHWIFGEFLATEVSTEMFSFFFMI